MYLFLENQIFVSKEINIRLLFDATNFAWSQFFFISRLIAGITISILTITNKNPTRSKADLKIPVINYPVSYIKYHTFQMELSSRYIFILLKYVRFLFSESIYVKYLV